MYVLFRFSSSTSDLAECFHEGDSAKQHRSFRVSFDSFGCASYIRLRHSYRFLSIEWTVEHFRVTLIMHALLGTLWRKYKCSHSRHRCSTLYIFCIIILFKSIFLDIYFPAMFYYVQIVFIIFFNYFKFISQ